MLSSLFDLSVFLLHTPVSSKASWERSPFWVAVSEAVSSIRASPGGVASAGGREAKASRRLLAGAPGLLPVGGRLGAGWWHPGAGRAGAETGRTADRQRLRSKPRCKLATESDKAGPASGGSPFQAGPCGGLLLFDPGFLVHLNSVRSNQTVVLPEVGWPGAWIP